MNELCIVSTRSGRVESRHPVSACVVDTAGRVVASAGDPERATYWRSAAKPMQALALVDEGAADRYGWGDAELALACASHASEPRHLELAARMLRSCGCEESTLACGTHPPLRGAYAHVETVAPPYRPLGNNCSGKHAGMIALARHLGEDPRGYEQAGHAVQQRILVDVCRTTGLEALEVGLGGDGCRAVTFFLPLSGMARAWSYLGHSDDAAPRRLRAAMWSEPDLVAGEGRACTRLLRAGAGRLLVKIGAEGIYCASLPEAGLALALKVESGDLRLAPIALLALLRDLEARRGVGLGDVCQDPALDDLRMLPVSDTRREPVGALEAQGRLRYA